MHLYNLKNPIITKLNSPTTNRFKNTDNIVIRCQNLKKLPDVENYIHVLHKKGILQELADKNNLNVNSIKKLPISRFCKIFVWEPFQKFEIGDIIVYTESGNYHYFVGGIS